MAARKNALREELDRASEITIHVTGRKSGRTISNPIWFVFEGGTIYLLPVYGAKTQWYQNVLKNPKVEIEARGAEEEFQAVPVTNPAEVAAVVERFRRKYGVGDVKKYYSGFDVAVSVSMT